MGLTGINTMSQLINCSKCSNELVIPSVDPFVKTCSCGTIYERTQRNGLLFRDSQNFQAYINHTTSSINDGILIFFVSAIGLSLLIGGFLYLQDFLTDHESDTSRPSLTIPASNPHNSKIYVAEKEDIRTYSGICIKYKKTFIDNKIKYTSVGEAVGKVVINHSVKKFSFYFDGRLVYTGNDYLSYIDDQLGGEGFTLSDGYSAHSLPAEKEFHIFYSPVTGEAGSEYRITDYKVD